MPLSTLKKKHKAKGREKQREEEEKGRDRGERERGNYNTTNISELQVITANSCNKIKIEVVQKKKRIKENKVK